jgi:DNA-binding transcriptional regulator GbsR (MarR family)
MQALAKQKNSAKAKDWASTRDINPLEAEVIGLFVQFTHALGQPRSIAEIYGLLFISSRPLNLDELIARLDMSKGSASQGLALLRKAGAIKMVYVPGDRRMHYEAVAELRKLVGRYFSDLIGPQLESGRERLGRIAEMVSEMPAGEQARVNKRIGTLEAWERNGRRFLPFLIKFLGS